MSQQRISMLRQSWPGQKFSVETKYFDSETKFAKARGKCVATEPVS